MNTSLLSAHSSTGLLTPVEVRPPERLVLALVETPGGGDHRDGGLFGGALLDAVAGELQQRAVEVVGGLDGCRRRATGCGPRGGTPDSMARAISQSRSRRVDRQS